MTAKRQWTSATFPPLRGDVQLRDLDGQPRTAYTLNVNAGALSLSNGSIY